VNELTGKFKTLLLLGFFISLIFIVMKFVPQFSYNAPQEVPTGETVVAFAEESEPISKKAESTELITPDSERGKELLNYYLTQPAENVHTKHGDFNYIEVPSRYPSNEIANLDDDDDVTSDTKQVILRGYVYEKE